MIDSAMVRAPCRSGVLSKGLLVSLGTEPPPCTCVKMEPFFLLPFCTPILYFFASQLDDFPLKRRVFWECREGPIWGLKGQMVNSGFQDPKQLTTYRTRANAARPTLASSQWLTSTWTKMTMKHMVPFSRSLLHPRNFA